MSPAYNFLAAPAGLLARPLLAERAFERATKVEQPQPTKGRPKNVTLFGLTDLRARFGVGAAARP